MDFVHSSQGTRNTLYTSNIYIYISRKKKSIRSDAGSYQAACEQDREWMARNTSPDK